MRTILIILTVLVFVVSFTFVIEASELSLEEIKQSVGRVVCYKENNSESHGTGFVINTLGNIVTNHHVIDGCQRMKIEFSASESVELMVLHDFPVDDLAVLKPSSPLSNHPPLQLVPLEFIQEGQQVRTIGYSWFADLTQPTISNFNIIKQIQESSQTNGNRTQIQKTLLHGVEINPGNSGGPLLNECGDVTGIIQGHLEATDQGVDLNLQGANYAIPSSILIERLTQVNVAYLVISSPCRIVNPNVYIFTVIIVMVLALSLTSLYVAVNQSRRQAITETVTKLGKTVWLYKGADRQPHALITRTAFVIGTAGEFAQQEFPVETSSLIFGRDPALANIVFPDTCHQISRNHAKLLYDRATECFILEDLHSRSGTFLATGEPVLPGEHVTLQDGDVFYLATPDQSFQVVEK